MPKNRKIVVKEKLASKRGRPPVTPKKVRTIAKMLTQKVDLATISRTTKLSLTTVVRKRADYRAITLDEALSHIEEGEYLPDIEYHDAEERARRIPEKVRAAIIQGIVDAIPVTDILDPVPLDPRLAFAPQQVEPDHKPPSRLETHTIRKKLR